eukprot:m.60298 g.60298  ORF g.60298 m.60298 type:complete len:256 (+) comp22822_c0_seq1:338-1105(+)
MSNSTSEEWDTLTVGSLEQWLTVMLTWVLLTAIEIIIGLKRHAYSGITFSFIQNLKSSEVAKDSVRNIYGNIAIVGALLMTIAFSMILIEDSKVDEFPILSHLYFGFTIVSMLQCVRAVFEAVISLMYTEPLSGADCVKYLIASPGSMGGPVIGITTALMCLLLASCVRATMNWSLAAGVGLFTYTMLILLFLLKLFRDKRSFSPDPNHPTAKAWDWVESETKPCPNEHMFSRAQIKTLRSKHVLLIKQGAVEGF